jgi:glycosyltransferase involved in cell wall biosynthesis
MNKPLTVCFFNTNRAWGGGEKWHFTTAKEFARWGHTTFIVTNPGSQLEKKAHAERVDFIPFRVTNLSFINPIKILVLALMFKSKKVDAIVMNLPSDLKVAGIAAKIAGVKKIIYRRGMPHPLRNTWLNRFLFKKILTHVVVNSKEIGRSLKQGNEAWFPDEKVVLIYNGVDTRKALPVTGKLYEKKGQEIVIGNAGRLTEQKGQKYLIELAELLRADGKEFVILIAGEGELGTALHKLIQEKNLQEHVKLLGHVNDMTAFFNSLDVFVFTSLYEGSANTLIETLWHKVPTVAWDVSSNPEIVVSGETGYLENLGDCKALQKSIEKAIENKELLIQLGQNKVRTDFDNFNNLKKLSDVLYSQCPLS